MRLFAGRLKHFTQAWSKITSDNFNLSAISGYKIPFSSTPTQSTEPSNHLMTGAEDAAMQEAVEDLLALGVVKRCQEVVGQFVSSIFLVPKSNGK